MRLSRPDRDPADIEQQRGHHETPFVGRADELNTLISAVSTAPSLVTVSGAAGLGKTRIVAELAKATPEVPTLIGRCHRLRDPFPLGPLSEVTRKLKSELAALSLSPVTGALRPLVPELADVLPEAPSDVADRESLLHLQFRAFAEVLRAVGRATLIIEDAHWIDTQTVEFLGYVLEDPPPDLAVVITYRSDQVPPSVPALAARAQRRLTTERVELGPWDPAATAAMAAGMLGVDRVSADFADHLCRRSAGIPLAAQELMRLLLARGSVVHRDGEWLRHTIDELDVPAGVRDPVLERAGMLDEDVRAVLDAASVIQAPVSPSVLVDVAGLSGERGDVAVSAVQMSGLVVERDHRVEPIHLLAAQAIYDDLVPGRRRELHRRAAAALRNLPDPPLGQLAHHFRAAGRTQEWIDAAQAAAEQAWHAGDDEEVVTLLEPIVAVAPLDSPQGMQLAKALARSAAYSARSREVANLLASALLDNPDLGTADMAELALNVAILVYNTWGRPDLLHRLARIASDAPELEYTKRVQAFMLQFERHIPGRSREDSLQLLATAALLVPRDAVDEHAVFAAAKIADCSIKAGDPDWRRHLRGNILQRSPDRRLESLAVINIADDAAQAGHYDLARDLIRACEQVDDTRTMPPMLRAYAQQVGFAIDYWTGNWHTLEESLRSSRDERVASAISDSITSTLLGSLAVSRQGPSADVTAMLDDVLTEADDVGSLEDLANAAGPRARIQDAQDPQETFPGLMTLVRAIETGAVFPFMYRALAPLTRLFAVSGNTDLAAGLVDHMSHHATHLDAPLAAGALDHARGHLATAHGDALDAARQYLSAAGHHDDTSMPLEAALAREAAAIALATTGVARATDVMREALEVYERIGAGWELDRATNAARQHGLSVPARHRAGRRGYGDELSPREREVAHLAADGRTNREIADALYLSINTVNRHMSAALRKLGVTSRRELADHSAEIAGTSD